MLSLGTSEEIFLCGWEGPSVSTASCGCWACAGGSSSTRHQSLNLGCVGSWEPLKISEKSETNGSVFRWLLGWIYSVSFSKCGPQTRGAHSTQGTCQKCQLLSPAPDPLNQKLRVGLRSLWIDKPSRWFWWTLSQFLRTTVSRDVMWEALA